MREYLLFSLYAPIAAMGEIAVGERRGSWDRPGKSAVMGLVAAALGIVREDAAAHSALSERYGYAVRIDAPGAPMRDYHTAQAPRARRGATYATRRQELAASNIETVLSQRDFRVDAAYTVALWQREGARWPLSQLAVAIKGPAFTLYFGRKSCPFALPLDPVVVSAADLHAAFATRPPPALLAGLALEHPARFASDTDADVPIEALSVTRRDAVLSRERWQFAERHEIVSQMPDKTAE